MSKLISNVEETFASKPMQKSTRLHIEQQASAASIRPTTDTAEERYWKTYRFPVLLKQSQAVTRCEFSPTQPFTIAATSGPQVSLIHPSTKSTLRSITRFKKTAFSASYRHDGALLCAGGLDPVVQIFDVSNPRAIIRSFKGGHKAAVHVARFSLQFPHVLSGSNDKTCCVWDVESGAPEPIQRFTGHQDYIRAAAPSLLSPSCWLTGSYDHTVKMWDTRTAGNQTLALNHGEPVEDILMFPGGTTVATAGGPLIKIWDLLGGGQLLQTLANHQKAVTCLFFDSGKSRLLSGSIDRMLKVYDLNSSLVSEQGERQFQVLHSVKYPAPILSAALSPDDKHLMVGMSDGVVSIRSRPTSEASKVAISPAERSIALQFHVQGQHDVGEDARARPAGASDVADYKVGQRAASAGQKRRRLKPYERMLKKFKYYEALNAALATNDAVIFTSLCKELIRRRSLRIALSGRDQADLLPILKIMARNIRHPRHSPLLVTVFEQLLTIYSPILGQSAEIDGWFRKIQRKLHLELEFQREILKLLGTLDIYVASS